VDNEKLKYTVSVPVSAPDVEAIVSSKVSDMTMTNFIMFSMLVFCCWGIMKVVSWFGTQFTTRADRYFDQIDTLSSTSIKAIGNILDRMELRDKSNDTALSGLNTKIDEVSRIAGDVKTDVNSVKLVVTELNNKVDNWKRDSLIVTASSLGTNRD